MESWKNGLPRGGRRFTRLPNHFRTTPLLHHSVVLIGYDSEYKVVFELGANPRLIARRHGRRPHRFRSDPYVPSNCDRWAAWSGKMAGVARAF